MASGMSNSSGTNLVDLLMKHPFGPDDGLLFTIDQTITAGDARTAVTALAGTLRRAGVEPGQAVAVARANDTSYVIAMFAVWAAGAVFVPINRRAPEVDRRYSLDATGARFLIDDDGVQIVDGAAGAEPLPVQPGRRLRIVDLGHDGTAQTDRPHPPRVPGAARPRPRTPSRRRRGSRIGRRRRGSRIGRRRRGSRIGRRRSNAAQETVAEPDPGVPGAQRRHLQRALRAAGRRRPW